MDSEDFYAWRWDNCIRDADILSATGITRRTLRRWKTTGLPLMAINAIRHQRGELRQWPGWRINRSGQLCDPHQGIYSPGQIMATRYYRELIRSLKLEIKVLSARNERREFLQSAAND